MTMIEKMARAMAVANNDYDGDYLCWSAYENDARAALEALLEPSEAMVERGDYGPFEGDVDFEGPSVYQVWQAMIRAALEEK